MIISDEDISILEPRELRLYKNLNLRLEGSRNMKLDPEIAPYIDVEGSIREQEENIRRYIRCVKQAYKFRDEALMNLINKENEADVREYAYNLGIYDKTAPEYWKEFYEWLLERGEYKIIEHFGLERFKD